MNLRKIAILSVAALSVLGSTLAEARGPYRHGGRALLFAAPFIAAGAYLASRPYRPYYRPYYPPAYYYPPAPVYYPPTYIERTPEYLPPPEQQYAVPPQSQYSAPQQQQYSAPQPQYSEPQQPQAQTQPQPDSSWYFCAESQAYYPNVQNCAGGWQRQAPQQR